MIPPTQNQFTTADSKALAAKLDEAIQTEPTPEHDALVRDFWITHTADAAHDELGLTDAGEEIVTASRDFLRTALAILAIVIALAAIVVGLVIA